MSNKINNVIRNFCLLAMTICITLSCGNKQVLQKCEAKLVTKKMFDGNIKAVGATIDGKKIGMWIEYDDEDRVSAQRTYFEDSLCGESISYFENGDVLRRGILKNGQEEGEWLSYYGNKKIEEKGNYKNGNKVGVWEYFIEDGRLNKKIDYTNKGEKIILDNHLLLPTPDSMKPSAITDSNNNVIVK